MFFSSLWSSLLCTTTTVVAHGVSRSSQLDLEEKRSNAEIFDLEEKGVRDALARHQEQQLNSKKDLLEGHAASKGEGYEHKQVALVPQRKPDRSRERRERPSTKVSRDRIPSPAEINQYAPMEIFPMRKDPRVKRLEKARNATPVVNPQLTRHFPLVVIKEERVNKPTRSTMGRLRKSFHKKMIPALEKKRSDHYKAGAGNTPHQTNNSDNSSCEKNNSSSDEQNSNTTSILSWFSCLFSASPTRE